MIITKCDICKKLIGEDQLQFSLTIFGGDPVYVYNAICKDCGKPLMPFVKKYHLDENKRSRPHTRRRSA